MTNILPKISFITACKGRLHHLAETLPKNIIWNAEYPNIEFVLLDYNSPDGLETWVKNHMSAMIEKGLLLYFKNPEPQYFHYTHSRNMLLKLATGDIVCNLDADNYSGADFAFYIAERMNQVDYLIANRCSEVDGYFNPLASECFGRIAVKKELILHAGGYLESLESWGAEDRDLYNRLHKLGYKGGYILSNFLRCISHSNQERGMFLKDKNAGYLSESHNQNMLKCRENIEKGKLIVNDNCFGKGVVYKNFSKEPMVVL